MRYLTIFLPCLAIFAATCADELIEQEFRDYPPNNFHRTKKSVFKVVENTDADDFPQHLATIIEKNPCIHSTCDVNYWICNLGSITAITEAAIVSSRSKDYYVGYNLAEGTEKAGWILHGRKEGTRISYRGFYVTNEKNLNKEKQKSALKQMQQEVQAHLDSESCTIEKFYVFKIHLAKVDERTRGAVGRKVLSLMDLTTDTKPVLGTHRLFKVETSDEDRTMKSHYFDKIDLGLRTKQNLPKALEKMKTEARDIHTLLSNAAGQKQKENRVRATTLAISKSLGIIANRYDYFLSQGGTVTVKYDEMMESWSHGFTHGVFEHLFRDRYRISILSELRGGAGYIDLFLLFNGGGTARLAIPIIIEFKQPQSGTAPGNVDMAYEQIDETRYDLIIPAIRGSPESVILLGAAFNADPEKRIKGRIKKTKSLENTNLINVMEKIGRSRAKTRNQKDPLDGIRTVAEWMYFSNPNAKNVPHAMRKILARITAEISARGPGNSMEVDYFWTSWPALVEPEGKDLNKGQKEIQREAITILMRNANGEGPLYCLCISEFRGVGGGPRTKTAYIDAANELHKLNEELEALRETGPILDSAEAKQKMDKIGNIHLSIADGSGEKIKLPNIEMRNGRRLKEVLEENGRQVIRVDIVLKQNANSFASFLQSVSKKDVNVQQNTDASWIEEPERIGKVRPINQGLDVKRLIPLMTRQAPQRGENVAVALALEPFFRDFEPLIGTETDVHALLSGALETDNDHLVLNEQSSGFGRIDLLLINKADHILTAVELKHKPAGKREDQLKLAYDQAVSYARHLNHFTEEDTAKCLAIVYYAPNEIATNEGPGAVLPFCDPVSQHHRGKRSTTCQSFGGSGLHDTASHDERLRNKQIPLQERLELSQLRKQLKNPDASLEDIAASPCADKLPWNCIDQFTPPTRELDHEGAFMLKGQEAGKMKALYSKLTKVSDFAGRAWWYISTLDLIDQSIKRNDYAPLAKHIAYTAVSHAMPYLGKGAALALEHREIIGLVGHELERAGMPPFLAHRLARIATVHISARVHQFVYRTPMGVWSIATAALDARSLIQTVRSSEWAQVQRIDKVIYISVQTCNIAANVAYTAVAITGQIEAEPVIAVVHLTCLAAGHIATNIRTTTSIDEYVVLSWREKYGNFFPLFNNMETLKTDQVVHYAHEYALNRSSLQYFSAVAVPLYAVRVNMSSGQIANMTLPQNVRVRIVNSPLNESYDTPSMSRTLTRLNSNGRRLACAPTAPDAVEDCSGIDSCINGTKTYTIPNLSTDAITDEHHNYCDYAMMAVNVTLVQSVNESNRTHSILFDLPSLNCSVIEANSTNHVCYIILYGNTIVRISCSLKNHFVLMEDFNPANVELDPHAQNTMDLNGYNFSAAQAKSPAGSRLDRIVGNHGSRTITAGKRTSFVVSGGAEAVGIDMGLSEQPHIHVDLYENNYLDLSYYKHNAVSVNLIERSEGPAALNWTNGTSAMGMMDGPSKIDCPMREDFNLETDMVLMIMNPANIGLLGLLQVYTYSYNSRRKTFHIDKRGVLFSEIYSVSRTERVGVGIKTPSVSLRVRLFFNDYVDDEALLPEFQDREIRLPDETSHGDIRQLILNGPLADETAATLHDSRVRAYNYATSEALLVDYRRFGTLFFTTSSYRSSLIKFANKGGPNFVFIEGCGDVEILIDERYNSSVHIETDPGLAAKNVDMAYSQENNTLLVTYECGEHGKRSIIQVYPFVSKISARRKVTVRVKKDENIIRSVVPSDADGSAVFTASVKPMGYDRQYRSICFNDDAQLVKSFTTWTNLQGVKSLFFPDVFRPKDLEALRSGNTLLLFEKRTKRSFSFPSYYANSIHPRIHMHFVHGYATLRSFAENAQDLAEYAEEKRNELLAHLVDDGHLDCHTVEDDLEVHAANLTKLLVLYVECEPERGNVTVVSAESAGAGSKSTLRLLVCGYKVTIYGWEETSRRPLLAFPTTILDLTAFGVAETAKMRAAIEVLETDVEREA